jgi:hypothetical protein
MQLIGRMHKPDIAGLQIGGRFAMNRRGAVMSCPPRHSYAAFIIEHPARSSRHHTELFKERDRHHIFAIGDRGHRDFDDGVSIATQSDIPHNSEERCLHCRLAAGVWSLSLHVCRLDCLVEGFAIRVHSEYPLNLLWGIAEDNSKCRFGW